MESQAQRLGRLAVELQGREDVLAVWQRVVAVAVSDVDGAELAGVTVLDGYGADTPAASDPLVSRIDALQYATGEGPCLSAAYGEPVVRSDDLGADDRWPRFAFAAVGLGVRSMLSVQMFVEAGTIGALNLYARHPDAFPWEADSVAVPLAAHAAIAVANLRTEGNLRVAVASRDVIGQAKGILMERFRVDAARAFELLIAASHDSHRKLREVAEELATTGAFEQPSAAAVTAAEHDQDRSGRRVPRAE